MYLSVKEFYFFSLIFVVITLCLFVFNRKLVTSKNSCLHLCTLLIVSLCATLSFVLTYKIAKIGNPQTDNFHFEVSPGKKCRGYPYMQSGNPKLLEECTKFLSTEEGKKMASCDGMYVGRPSSFPSFEYTPESDYNWENKRCKCDSKGSKIIPINEGDSSEKIVPNNEGDSSEKIIPNTASEQVPIYHGNSLGIIYNNSTFQPYERYVKKQKNVSFLPNQ